MDLRSVSADRSLLVFPVHRLEPQSMFSLFPYPNCIDLNQGFPNFFTFIIHEKEKKNSRREKGKLYKLSLNQIMWIILIAKFYKILLKGKIKTKQNKNGIRGI